MGFFGFFPDVEEFFQQCDPGELGFAYPACFEAIFFFVNCRIDFGISISVAVNVVHLVSWIIGATVILRVVLLGLWVVKCNESKREVTVMQNAASKQLDRVFMLSV